jgi:glycosyltransferase involved in cell wall biosynthesis
LSDPRLHGVLVTFRRPEDLKQTLRRLAAQTTPLESLIVVDNGSDPATRQALDAYPGPIHYLDPGENVGPAGGYALGMNRLLETADDAEWIVLFDDDDPPFFDDALECAARFAGFMADSSPKVGGVGISGGRFDTGRGKVVRIGDAEITGSVPVDHITAGGLPAYRVGAVREVGVFLAELFFGFEELEYGLRLTAAGHPLFADGAQWARRKAVKRDAGLLPPEEVSAARAGKSAMQVGDPTWRRYYSLRNLIYLLRRQGAAWPALRVSLGRGISKPLVNLPLHPGPAWANLKMNSRAVRDAWLGRMGRTVTPG